MAEKLIEAVVARNRTVHDRIITGSKESPEIVDVIKVAGQKVRLPEAEVVRLRELGFLVPEKVEEVKLEGAQITGGQVSIKPTE